MSLEYIRRCYGVPAYRGMRVHYRENEDRAGYKGTITSADGAYLRIRRDGETRTYPARFHPTWNIEYLQPPEDEK